MPRIRTIKPELPEDRKLASVSRDARYTFILLITQAEDNGLIAGSHRQLLGSLYPHEEDVTVPMVLAWIDELRSIGILRWRETMDGARVLEVVNWSKHQRIDNRGRSQIADKLLPVDNTPPLLAAPETEACGISRNLAAKVPSEDVDSRICAESLGEIRVGRGVGVGVGVGGGIGVGAKQQDQKQKHTAASPPRVRERSREDDPEFAAAWARYPKRGGGNPERPALRAWQARRRTGVSAEDMAAGLERYRTYCERKGILGTEFVLQARTFFGRDERYAEAWELPPPGTNGAHPPSDDLERRAAQLRADEDAELASTAAMLAARRANAGGTP